MYYSYKYARASTPFWRQKVEPVFRFTGPSAASHLSTLMSFDYTEQGSNYWFSVYAWLTEESNRKITDCPILWKDKTAAYLLCVMLIITENMTKHYPSEIILPDTRAQKPPRVMPRIRDSKGFWPDESIVYPPSRAGRSRYSGQASTYIIPNIHFGAQPSPFPPVPSLALTTSAEPPSEEEEEDGLLE